MNIHIHIDTVYSGRIVEVVNGGAEAAYSTLNVCVYYIFIPVYMYIYIYQDSARNQIYYVKKVERRDSSGAEAAYSTLNVCVYSYEYVYSSTYVYT